ncbi:MAG: hypothetical protein JNM69_35610 [Archangium sp.]|nr:hypothetical protein [Archangium sp.]
MVACTLLLLSCLQPVQEGVDDGGWPADGGPRCVDDYGNPPQRVCAPRSPGTCAGKQCAVGETCCLLTLKCVAASDPSACSASAIDAGTGKACGSSQDCGPDQFCRSIANELCGGPGVCHPITNCGICVGGSMCPVCGCDGVTYESVQVACVAGVRVIQGACGERRGPRGVSCGRSDQCQQGDECCALTGKCFSPTERWRCPADSSAPVLDCTQNSDCSSGAGGGNPGPARWCAGQVCGQPGTCRPRVPSSTCTGTVQTVCGCDGLTYVNECWANAAGTRVARQSACDGGP